MKEKVLEIERDPRKRGWGKTVLVVDDSGPIRKMLAAAFLSDGFKTCGEAANGNEAIQVAKQLHPDVITMDYSMPGKNGIEVASAIKTDFPNTPIILFTLYGSRALEKEAAKAGVNLVLAKTIPIVTLIDKAHELMGDSEVQA